MVTHQEYVTRETTTEVTLVGSMYEKYGVEYLGVVIGRRNLKDKGELEAYIRIKVECP